MRNLKVKLAYFIILLLSSSICLAASDWPKEIDFNILCSDGYRYPLRKNFQNQMELSQVDHILKRVCVSKGLLLRDYSMRRAGGVAANGSEPARSSASIVAEDSSWPRKYNFAVKCSDNKSFNVMRTFLTAAESTESTKMNKSICEDMGFSFIADSPSLVGEDTAMQLHTQSVTTPVQAPAFSSESAVGMDDATRDLLSSITTRSESTQTASSDNTARENFQADILASIARREQENGGNASSESSTSSSTQNRAPANEVDDEPIALNVGSEGRRPTTNSEGITKYTGWPRTYPIEVECTPGAMTYKVTLSFSNPDDESINKTSSRLNDVCKSKGHEKKVSWSPVRNETVYFSSGKTSDQAVVAVSEKAGRGFPKTYAPVKVRCVLDMSNNNDRGQAFDFPSFRVEDENDDSYLEAFRDLCKQKGLFYRGTDYNGVVRNEY